MKAIEENDFIELAERLYDRFGSRKHYRIVKAEETEQGWILKIERVEKPEVQNESE